MYGHGSDCDDSPRDYSGSEDEGPRHGHRQQSQYPPPSSIRQSSGYSHGPNDGGYGQPHHATSQGYHSQGYGPPPDRNDRYHRGSSRTSSKGKSREHHPTGLPEEERRRPPREPAKYLTYLPGNVPESSTLANANKPGATTFVGDPRPYMHTDPNKPPEIAERAKRSKTRFQWYWPVEQVYGPDGKRLIPFPYIPDIDGPDMPPGYAPIDENGNFLPYDQDVIREVNEIIENSQGAQKSRKKKQQAADRRERNRQAGTSSNQPAYQPPPPPPPHPDYRGRDYHRQEQRDRDRGRDRDREGDRDSRYPPPGPSQQYRDPGPPLHHSYYQPYNQPPPPPPSNPVPPQQPPPASQPPRKGPALRILTLLIEDTRKDPGERDQLAEVRVPLKQLEGPDDGFWADANDVCKALQGGPSRVDGPAKVYTLRGKYRQYFLRINANGEAEYSSANLRVDKDRTLLCVIEAIPVLLEPLDHHHSLSTPQTTPRPMTPMSLSTGSPHTFTVDSAKRKRSDGSRLAPVEVHEQPGSYMSPQSVRAPSPSKDQGRPPMHPSKKPRHNATLDSDTEMSNARAEPHPWGHTYDPPNNINQSGTPEVMSPARSPDAGNEMDLDVSSKGQEPSLSPHQQQRYLPPPPQGQQQVSPPPQQTQNLRAESLPKLHTTPTLPTGSNSHTWTEDDKNLIEQLRSRMSNDPGYNEFLESRNKQLTMREQLKHYTYIMKQLEEYTHGGTNAKKMHVMGVFNLPESWADTAQETVQLFALYGPDGSEFEDRRIIDMMDEIPPITGKMQASKFLDRLRQLHREQNDD